MSHYLDIHLLPDPEFPAHQLLSALYAKLHRALVRVESERIGVSFPGYDLAARRLGDCLRLIGPESDLAFLLSSDWLIGMRDHIRVSEAVSVPPGAMLRTLRRVQAKSNPERLRRRQMKRHGLTETQAAERVPLSVTEHLALPYIQVTSASTGQAFRLFLCLGPTETTAVSGPFNAYGLSASATIPWF